MIKIIDKSNINYFEYKTKNINVIIKKSNDSISSQDEVACALMPNEIYTLEEVKSIYVGRVITINPSTKEPFVKIGDLVDKGQVLCIIKCLNINIDIISDFKCTIEEICINNKIIVDYGKTLFKVRKHI